LFGFNNKLQSVYSRDIGIRARDSRYGERKESPKLSRDSISMYSGENSKIS
jgi:hypothetical protein